MEPEIIPSPDTGVLKVSAFSVSQGRPEAGAEVTIRDENGVLLSQGVTDEDGLLRPVWVSAPAEKQTESPLPEGAARPYRPCVLTAESRAGEVVTVTGLPLYGGTVSLQSVVFPGQSSFIRVPPPGLWEPEAPKIPEAEQKPLPDFGGTVVLDRPVVPEWIIVHAGVPEDAAAPNYRVGFTEYIKNVASSEIYDSWPEEAIRANLIAICSFTLSRVYTEWYRGKGYDFTITSSTAYDQAFTYGRTIFSRISRIADEVFAMYLTRPGAVQPLFAQYCDGERVKRAGWLSQWGSRALAEQGYDALRILQYYYGRNIILREAEKVQGVPQSFQGVLKRGSRGNAVRTLQRQLNAIAKNYPRIPVLSADGIYGPKTEAAVRVFQEIFHLTPDGITGYATWYRVSNVYTAVEGLAENN